MEEPTIEQLKQLIRTLSWNDGYGCYTRAGFEKIVWETIRGHAKWVVFFDIDDMHDLNQQHGYEGVNEIIRKSLEMRKGDYMAGQWFSGDEFIIIITDEGREDHISDPVEFCVRLAEIFRRNGASATFSIAPVISQDLAENVLPAQSICQKAKAEHRRGTINILPGEQQ